MADPTQPATVERVADAAPAPGPAKTPVVSARTKARKAALDILFQADLLNTSVLDVLGDAVDLGETAVRPYTDELVRDVAARREEIDALIAANLPDGWTLARMPRVDRNLARVAVSEITAHRVGVGVAISEAVALAGDLSTDESPAFLGGVLSAVAKTV